MSTFLKLPTRPQKPRSRGLTVVLDGGCPTRLFEDTMESFGEYIDYVKFGWGTAAVTPQLARKIACARAHKVEPFLGGSYFEKALLQGQLDAFRRYIGDELKLETVEISNGTINLDNTAKAEHIRAFASSFRVFSEVGYKDTQRSLELSPARWIAFMYEDLAAGSSYVVTESRESGTSGICRENGELRIGLIAEILDSGLPQERIVWEAPNKSLQVSFIRRLGSNVNLGNIALDDVVPLETLRLGLRGDTLELFEGRQDSTYA